MFAYREFDWLDRRFMERGYDLIYLDPLVCDPALRRSTLSRLSLWRSEEEREIASFLSRLIETLDIKHGDISPSSFMDEGGFGAQFNSDRNLQRRVAQVINHQAEVAKQSHTRFKVQRYYTNVAALQRSKALLEKIADRTNGASLIIADAMVIRRAAASKAIQIAVDVPVQHQVNSLRTIEYLLADSPGPLLTLQDPIIGLMVNRQAVSYCTDAFNAIFEAGWYPYARVIGLYATIPGGHPYINAIAIMARPFPSLDTLLSPPPGETPECCLPSTLEHILPKLDQEIKTLHEEKTTQAAIEKGTVISGKRVYEKDFEFLYPAYLLQLCCKLNRVGWHGLQDKANRAFQVIKAYMQRLMELQECLKTLGIDSQIVSMKMGVEDFLPELELRYSSNWISTQPR